MGGSSDDDEAGKSFHRPSDPQGELRLDYYSFTLCMPCADTSPVYTM